MAARCVTDPRASVLSFLALVLRMMGYPDQARCTAGEAAGCAAGLQHGSPSRAWMPATICTRVPSRPRSTGKAKGFIKTMLAYWAYVIPYRASATRRRELPRLLHLYNHLRPPSQIQTTTSRSTAV